MIIPKTLEGKNVVAIDWNAFEPHEGNPTVLKSLVLPHGLRTIAADAFYLNDLRTITIPETVTFIGASAFSGSKNAKIYISENNPNYKTSENNTGLFSKDGKTIYFGTQETFETATYERVEVIDIYAFIKNDIRLAYIPASAEEISSLAFMYNENIRFNISSGNPYYANGDNYEGMYDKELTDLYGASRGIFATNTYKNVQRISNTAFYGGNLNYAFIPKSVTSIDSYAFRGNKI